MKTLKNAKIVTQTSAGAHSISHIVFQKVSVMLQQVIGNQGKGEIITRPVPFLPQISEILGVKTERSIFTILIKFQNLFLPDLVAYQV